ncbi:helix-turn-helix domain-containing protein [Serratia proteamaculans]|uniref:winged helix-turn-helix domain-containing protein n=1 Tax=Serratia proteamaculans TaxID=28151 RepID=UPI001076B0A8|nr:helix-turn-helix domain-containing protein [Serratia proteamaculans]TFZ48875.1 helix-turn-helix domain-containing protein [Serratia proteamaculans]
MALAEKKLSLVENDFFALNSKSSILIIKSENKTIHLTELQRRLFRILLSGVTKKQEVIESVWENNHVTITDNNYHQLIYQCRTLLSRHGIPPEVIKTIPRYGVRFNFSPLEEVPSRYGNKLSFLRGKLSAMLSNRQRLIRNILILMIINSIFIVSAMV